MAPPGGGRTKAIQQHAARHSEEGWNGKWACGCRVAGVRRRDGEGCAGEGWRGRVEGKGGSVGGGGSSLDAVRADECIQAARYVHELRNNSHTETTGSAGLGGAGQMNRAPPPNDPVDNRAARQATPHIQPSVCGDGDSIEI